MSGKKRVNVNVCCRLLLRRPRDRLVLLTQRNRLVLLTQRNRVVLLTPRDKFLTRTPRHRVVLAPAVLRARLAVIWELRLKVNTVY